MTIFNLSLTLLGVLALWGAWLGVKALRRIFSYRSSRYAAKRYNMRDSNMRVRLENCPGEYCVLDMSQSGMAIFIDHFADGFSLAKRTKFILRTSHGEVAARLIMGKVIYLKQLDHGYRMGIQFDSPLEISIVEAYRIERIRIEEAVEQIAA